MGDFWLPGIVYISTTYFLIIVLYYAGQQMFRDIKTKKQQGKAILKSIFWIFVFVYNLLIWIFKAIVWIFECMVALFKTDEEEEHEQNTYVQYVSRVGDVLVSETIVVPEHNYEPITIVAKHICTHCGSGKQYNSTCNRCGAPIQ